MKNIRILTLGIAWTLSVVISINLLAMQPNPGKTIIDTQVVKPMQPNPGKTIIDKQVVNPMQPNPGKTITDKQAVKPLNQPLGDPAIVEVGQKRKTLDNDSANDSANDKGPARKKACPNSIFEKNSNYLNNCEIFVATLKRCYQNQNNITFEEFKKEIGSILTDLEKLDPSNNLNNNITAETVDYQKNKQKFDLISNFINKTSDITLTLQFQPMSFINWTTTIGNLMKAEDNLKEKTKTSNRWYWGTVTPLATAIIIGLYNSMA